MIFLCFPCLGVRLDFSGSGPKIVQVLVDLWSVGVPNLSPSLILAQVLFLGS